jgi:hypothetical protein
MYAWHDHHTPARVEETPVGIHKADLDVNCYDVISCVPSCHHQTNSACQDMRGKKCNCGEDIRSTSILRSSHLNMAVIWIHDSIKTSKHQPTNHRWVKHDSATELSAHPVQRSRDLTFERRRTNDISPFHPHGVGHGIVRVSDSL